ncbi:MAG: rhodanese-like domain-containing protein [Chloroflexota bacterium]
MLFPLLMVGAGLVLIIGSVIWTVSARSSASADLRLATPGSSAAGPTGQPAAEQPAMGQAPRIPYPDIARVSLADAKSAFDQQQAVFIDARGELYFGDGHIPGAIAMTSEEVLSRLGELDKNAWIIPYCT